MPHEKFKMHNKMAGTEFDHVLEGVVSSLFGENFTLKPEQKLFAAITVMFLLSCLLVLAKVLYIS